MSAQSAIYNPSQTTSAATGDGFSVPRLTTTGRLAITFGTADAGMMVYDTTLNNLFIWTGSAWESVPASGDAGANGAVQYNDNGVVSGASNFTYDKATSAVGITGDLTASSDVLVNGNEKYVYLSSNYSIGNNTRVRFRAVGAGGGSGYGGDFRISTRASNNTWNTDVLTIDSSANCIWTDGAGGTRMTLNSTGLGVGIASPNDKLTVIADSYLSFQTATTTFNSGRVGRIGAVSAGAGNGYLVFETYKGGSGGGERMRIDSDGNVGIGVTPSAWATTTTVWRALDLQYSCGIASSGAGSGEIDFLWNAYYDQTDQRWEFKYTGDRASRYAIGGAGVHTWYNTASTGTANAAITWVPAMTLDASGRLLVGTTSAVASGSTFENLGTARQVLTLKGNDATSYTLGLWSATTTGDNFFAYFGTEASTTVRGSVTYNRAGGLVAYNTTSDYRAKDIIGPVSNSGSLIDSLKVYLGKMKGATIERPMLIAHEAQSVAPYAVTGTKDEVDADGNPKYQQMDVSALVPVLIAEIQSLRARVQTLETR